MFWNYKRQLFILMLLLIVREPEHGAGRQQEALPHERRDCSPLIMDADYI